MTTPNPYTPEQLAWLWAAHEEPAMPETTAELTVEYTAWLAANGFPDMSAEELAAEFSETITMGQLMWLSVFMGRWDAAQAIEDAAE